MNDDVECPYCGAGQEICHDDGYGYEEDEAHEQECSECEKVFVFITSVIYSYDARQADCLNGGEHKFMATSTYSVEYTKMRCAYCDFTRKCTQQELEQVKIDRSGRGLVP